jgi:hypothetical protein
MTLVLGHCAFCPFYRELCYLRLRHGKFKRYNHGRFFVVMLDRLWTDAESSENETAITMPLNLCEVVLTDSLNFFLSPVMLTEQN